MLLRVLQELSTPSSPASTNDEGPCTTSPAAQEAREASSNSDDEPGQVGASGGGPKEMHVEVASMRITVVNDCAGYNEPFVVLCLQRMSAMHLARKAKLAPYTPASSCQVEGEGLFESCSVMAARIQVMWCFLQAARPTHDLPTRAILRLIA